MSDLQDIARRVAACTDCGLAKGRTRAVPGEGPEQAQVMFIGEGPGYNEDQQGRPFVGAAGQLLEQLLATAGLSRSQVFITNMVKCRPPNNRDPLPGEIAACSKYLDRQIELIKPKVIVTLGRYSLGKFLPGQTIGKVHGKPRTVGQQVVCPMYHPAAALHQASLKKDIEQDFKTLASQLREAAQAETPKEPEPKQMSMF
ncbi:MAG: uracil-DNA glycosylase [Chloroflexi bacterium]|nr:uracil-DNA glycosylase [Chloroflexota bacterium]